MIGPFLLVSVWVVAGLIFYKICTHEDREQKRTRKANENGGHYPPVRTLASRTDARLFMSKNSEPSDPEH